MGFPGGSDGKESACNAGDLGLISGLEGPLEKGTVTHTSILAWRIPWTEKPGGPQSMEGHKESDMTNTYSLKMVWPVQLRALVYVVGFLCND